MNSAICRCGRPKKPMFATCWRCKTAAENEAAYMRGYIDGVRASHKPASEPPSVPLSELHAARIKQLIQLCHPDRHHGSAAANDATAWLLKIRARLLEGASRPPQRAQA
jgi:hypothetical protein